RRLARTQEAGDSAICHPTPRFVVTHANRATDTVPNVPDRWETHTTISNRAVDKAHMQIWPFAATRTHSALQAAPSFRQLIPPNNSAAETKISWAAHHSGQPLVRRFPK